MTAGRNEFIAYLPLIENGELMTGEAVYCTNTPPLSFLVPTPVPAKQPLYTFFLPPAWPIVGVVVFVRCKGVGLEYVFFLDDRSGCKDASIAPFPLVLIFHERREQSALTRFATPRLLVQYIDMT
jgi:hypothetical protein